MSIHGKDARDPNHRPGFGPLVLLAALLFPLGCTSTVNTPNPYANAPKIRVRLIAGADNIILACGVPPLYQLSTQNQAVRLNSPHNAIFSLSLTQQGWMA